MIAHELTALGAQFNAFTGTEYTGYYAKAQAEKLPKILEIVSDLYLHPLFDEAEIEKERGVIIQEINMYEDDLPARAQRIFDALVYGDQPAGWDVGGEKPIIQKLARADFVSYRNQRYVMPGTVVIVAGKFGDGGNTCADQKIFRRAPAPHGAREEKNRGAAIRAEHKIAFQGIGPGAPRAWFPCVRHVRRTALCPAGAGGFSRRGNEFAPFHAHSRKDGRCVLHRRWCGSFARPRAAHRFPLARTTSGRRRSSGRSLRNARCFEMLRCRKKSYKRAKII